MRPSLRDGLADGLDGLNLSRSDRYDYDFLPPRFFDRAIEAFIACHRAGRRRLSRPDRPSGGLRRRADGRLLFGGGRREDAIFALYRRLAANPRKRG
jgi:hypothetical protein